MTDIKAIILDWGGVLIDDPTPAMMAYFANSLSVTAENYIKAHRKFIADLENGDMTENAFWKNVCAELGISKLPALSLWMEGFKHVYSPKQDMFSLARALHRSGYKTAVLSNTEAPSVEYFRQQDYDMFDTVIFSCEERMKKPELRIYQTAASRLAVPPEQIVFIDDRQEHIDGAKKAGLNAILFENYQQVIRALSDLSVKVTARLY